jgi:hypothetical protein
MVILSVCNANIYKICEFHRAIFSSFYNNSQPNLAILLIWRCSFQLWFCSYCLDQNFVYSWNHPFVNQHCKIDCNVAILRRTEHPVDCKAMQISFRLFFFENKCTKLSLPITDFILNSQKDNEDEVLSYYKIKYIAFRLRMYWISHICKIPIKGLITWAELSRFAELSRLSELTFELRLHAPRYPG